MSLHSRLPPGFSLEERVTAINLLCGKLSERGAQIERLRWRVAIELYAVQEIVSAEGLEWEPWCRAHINRSYGDIRKLVRMARAHDPEAAHQVEKAATKARMVRTRNQRAHMRVVEAEQSADVARQLIRAILSKYSIDEARGMLELVEVRDLIEALNAEVVPAPALRIVS
jgi:hypothetical protein